MIVVELTEDKEELKKAALKIEKEKIECHTTWLTSKAKSKLRFFIAEILKKISLDKYIDDATYIVMELVFNAIKARYAHIITMRNLRMLLPQYKEKYDKDKYLENEDIMFQYIRILKDNMTKEELKNIIKMENNLFKDIDHNADIPENKYERLKSFKYDAKKRFVIKITAEKKNRNMVFGIISDSPLTMISKTRIDSKRLTFREYYKNNAVDKFFLEQLDNSEIAGFGLALSDLRLLKLGLDPKEHLIIYAKQNQTFAKLILPIKGYYSPINSYGVKF